MIQWLGLCPSTAGRLGLIPGQGTKIPQATRSLQKKKKRKKEKKAYVSLANSAQKKMASVMDVPRSVLIRAQQ